MLKERESSECARSKGHEGSDSWKYFSLWLEKYEWKQAGPQKAGNANKI